MPTDREKDAATRLRKHANRWRRIREADTTATLSAPGGIKSGNVTRTKPRAAVRSKGHRGG